jgi:large subunit ribosomal protein L19e
MNVSAQRRIAAQILKCGVNRVFIDSVHLDDVSMAITRDDIRQLIKNGIIKKRYEVGVSRSRAKELHEKKLLGRARGFGSRKGPKTARMGKKRSWINRIRPLRRELKKLRDRKLIDTPTYRTLYLQSKGGQFHSVAHLKRHIEEQKLYRRI